MQGTAAKKDNGEKIFPGKAVRSMPEIDHASPKRARNVSVLQLCLGRKADNEMRRMGKLMNTRGRC
jgi:hypothetical protein